MHLQTFAEKFLLRYTSEEEDAGSLAMDIAVILQRRLGVMGVELFPGKAGPVLRGGSFGIAALLDGDPTKVLKLTTDPEEVKAASVVAAKGSGAAYVARVHVAAYVSDFRVEHIQTGMSQPVGVTVTERLDKVGMPTVRQADNLNWIVNTVKREFRVEADLLIRTSAAMARKRLMKASAALERRLQDTGDNDLAEIGVGVGELASMGVYAIDFHSGNVGFSNADGVHKVFDFGLSSLKAGMRPKVEMLQNPGGPEVLWNPADCWPCRSISAPGHLVEVLR